MNITKAANRDHKISKRDKPKKPATSLDDKKEKKRFDKERKERLKYKYGG